MTPTELKERLDKGDKLTLVDVREPDERKIASLGGVFLPLGELSQRYQELDPAAVTVVYCHHGMRSAHAVGFLRNSGFSDVHNLAGGIDRWALEIDTTIPRY